MGPRLLPPWLAHPRDPTDRQSRQGLQKPFMWTQERGGGPGGGERVWQEGWSGPGAPGGGSFHVLQDGGSWGCCPGAAGVDGCASCPGKEGCREAGAGATARGAGAGSRGLQSPSEQRKKVLLHLPPTRALCT